MNQQVSISAAGLSATEPTRRPSRRPHQATRGTSRRRLLVRRLPSVSPPSAANHQQSLHECLERWRRGAPLLHRELFPSPVVLRSAARLGNRWLHKSPEAMRASRSASGRLLTPSPLVRSVRLWLAPCVVQLPARSGLPLPVARLCPRPVLRFRGPGAEL